MSRLPLAALCFAAMLSAQTPGGLFDGFHWRLIGPFRGGRAVAAAGIAGDPNTYYFGAVGGGIWKTTDGGMVWTPIFDDQHVASIGFIEVAPSNPNVIYAGTGEADIRASLSSGDGVYKSTDAGKTWHNVGLRDSKQIGRILVDPKDPDVVYVAALGHAYGPNAERGVFRSRDGGRNWQKVLDKGPDIGAVDLAFEPENPHVIYATTWQTAPIAVESIWSARNRGRWAFQIHRWRRPLDANYRPRPAGRRLETIGRRGGARHGRPARVCADRFQIRYRAVPL